MQNLNFKLIFRFLALIVALAGIFGMHSMDGLKIFGWLGLITSLLAISEMRYEDLKQKVNLNETHKIRIETNWLGKIYMVCSTICVGITMFADISRFFK